jgi:hypothetical protein
MAPQAGFSRIDLFADLFARLAGVQDGDRNLMQS